jgi:hypothetical protein
MVPRSSPRTSIESMARRHLWPSWRYRELIAARYSHRHLDQLLVVRSTSSLVMPACSASTHGRDPKGGTRGRVSSGKNNTPDLNLPRLLELLRQLPLLRGKFLPVGLVLVNPPVAHRRNAIISLDFGLGRPLILLWNDGEGTGLKFSDRSVYQKRTRLPPHSPGTGASRFYLGFLSLAKYPVG